MASIRLFSKDLNIISKNLRHFSISQSVNISTSNPRNKLPAAVAAISQCNQRKSSSKPTSKTENRVDPAFSLIDLSFENFEEAYKSKTNLELVRALLVFNVCTINPIVDNNKAVSIDLSKLQMKDYLVNIRIIS